MRLGVRMRQRSVINRLWVTSIIVMLPVCCLCGPTKVSRTYAFDGLGIEPGSLPRVKQVNGPWGQLEYYEIVLVAPHRLVELYNVPPANPQWRFPNWNRQQLMNALRAMKFGTKQIEWVNEPGRLEVLADEVRLNPPNEMIFGMSSDQRLAIHRVLRRWEVNKYHYSVFGLESDNPLQLFKGLGFSDATAMRMVSLCFVDGGTTLFAELEYMLGQLTEPEERHRLLRMLTRTPCLLVRLKLTKESDIDSIVGYWGGVDRRKAIPPLLESVMFTEGVDSLDIAHFLPPTPRKLLNTFPDPISLHDGKYPDCFWTALNFFRVEASDRLFDCQAAMREVNEDYEAASGEPEFGDLIVLLPSESRAPLHAAIYIAADIVFTKNGRGLYSPWVMMRKDDMIGLYARTQTIQVERFRQRPRR